MAARRALSAFLSDVPGTMWHAAARDL